MTQTQPPLTLLDLPNCLIVQLMSYLDARTLYYLSRISPRLDGLIKNHKSLWKFIDARQCPKGPPKEKQDFVTYCTEMGHRDTHTFLIRGDCDSTVVTPLELFPVIYNFINLRILALEHQLITINSIKDLPLGLQELSLRKSRVMNETDFFSHSHYYMKNLRVLILDECDWLLTSALMPISKYDSLEILSVYKCKNLDNSIPYISLSGQFGFRKLKIFDARLSSIGSTLIHSLCRSKSLLAFYFQNEDISYKLDYFKRKLEILKGAPARSFNVDEFDVNDSQNNDENNSYYLTFRDRDLLDYVSIESNEHMEALPHSRLYLDPYNACTCGYEERQKHKSQHKKKSSSNGYDGDSDDDQDGGGDSLTDKIKTKIAHLAQIIRRNSGGGSRGPKFKIFKNLMEEAEDNHWVIKVTINPPEAPQIERIDSNELRKRLREESEGPPKKKAKTDDSEPTPGPSGLNNARASDSESETEEYQPRLDRPPTPHPELAVNLRENVVLDNPAILSFFRIENLADVERKTQVPLKRLSLRGYSDISNISLNYIKNLNLEVLDLTYTKVTRDGIDSYLKSHPLCRIVHESFCVCPTNLHF